MEKKNVDYWGIGFAILGGFTHRSEGVGGILLWAMIFAGGWIVAEYIWKKLGL